MACVTIPCQPDSISHEIKVEQNPTGAGGIALTDNFKEIQYRQPKCNYSGQRDPTENDSRPSYCVGSRWLGPPESMLSSGKMWICVNDTPGDAVWVPWLRWENEAKWDVDDDQHQVLVVDTHFGVDGEYRRISDEAAAEPLILVPYKTDFANGAVVLGIHDEEPGGAARGASAVDFQNERSLLTQVASGARSFIAGGSENRASGQFAFAQGKLSQAAGEGSHAQGFCEGGMKFASGRGSHVQGFVSGASSLIRATFDGAHAEGASDAGGGTSAEATGAHAEGAAKNGGTKLAGGEGAHAEGTADNGQIRAVTVGAHAEGAAESGGVIQVILNPATSKGNGGHAEGSATNGGLTQAAGEGAHAEGSADNGTILAKAAGAHVEGSAESGGAINVVANGGHAEGSAEGGTIAVDGKGAHAEGTASSGLKRASGEGSHAEGNAGFSTTPVGGQIVVDGNGGHAEGNAEDNGIIEANSNGCHVEGNAKLGGLIYAGLDSTTPPGQIGEGAHAEGAAENSSTIKATGNGAHAEGSVNHGLKQASGEGAHAEGNAGVSSTNTGGQIKATGAGAHAEGSAEDDGLISASGGGSHAEGFASETNSTVEATAEGAHAEGHAAGGGQVQATGLGAHAEGYVEAGESVLASGNGAHAEGGDTEAAAEYASVAGRSSKAALKTQHARASGKFSTRGDAQFTRVEMFRETTDATPTELTIDGEAPATDNRYAIADEHSYGVTATVHARGDSGQVHALFKRMLIIERTSGTVSLVGTPQAIGTDINPSGLAVSFSADNTNKSLVIDVTGLAAKTIHWIADVEALELNFDG